MNCTILNYNKFKLKYFKNITIIHYKNNFRNKFKYLYNNFKNNIDIDLSLLSVIDKNTFDRLIVQLTDTIFNRYEEFANRKVKNFTEYNKINKQEQIKPKFYVIKDINTLITKDNYFKVFKVFEKGGFAGIRFILLYSSTINYFANKLYKQADYKLFIV